MRTWVPVFCVVTFITPNVSNATPFIRRTVDSIDKNPTNVVSVATSRSNRSSNSVLEERKLKSLHQQHQESRVSRGGACNDSNPALFFKIAFSAVVETIVLLGVIVGSTTLSQSAVVVAATVPNVFGLSIIQWVSIVAVTFSASVFGSLVDGGLSAATNQVLSPNMIPGDAEWFDKLKKPFWNPPGWLFPIMWLIVSKPTQLIAVSKILRNSAASLSEVDTKIMLPLDLLAVYCAQLALGDAWNKVFFGLQCTGRGAAVITAFFGTLLLSAYLFYAADEAAGKFMLPTCGWVLIATSLNWSIYFLNKNPPEPEQKPEKRSFLAKLKPF